MRAWIAAGLMLAAPATAGAQAPEQLYRDGVAARMAGDAVRAVELLEQAVAAEPANADAQLQLGLALLAAGRLDDAEAAFAQTLTLAPDYTDARIGLARLAQRRGDVGGARAALEPVPAGNAEADALRRVLAADPTERFQLDLDLAYGDVEGAQPDWREAAVQLRYQASAATALAGRAEFARRFGKSDVFGEIRVDRRFGQAGGAYFGVGGTPSADFRPEWQIAAGGHVRVRGGGDPTVLTLDARQARFATGDIQTLSPGVEQYLAGGRAWLTGRWINIFDADGDHLSGWSARGDLLATPRLRLFAGLADAPDTDLGVVTDTFSFFGGAALEVSRRYVLRLSVAHEDRETGADRLQIGAGIGVRF